jgi:hypothetical protein
MRGDWFRRSTAPAPRSPDEANQYAGDARGLLTEIRNIERILDGT